MKTIKIFGKEFNIKAPSFYESEIDSGAAGIVSRFTIEDLAENVVVWLNGEMCLGLQDLVNWPTEFPEPQLDPYNRIILSKDDYSY